MRISIIGSGYVGTTIAACFADMGHDIVNIDINEDIITAINDGRTPIHEPGLDELIATHGGDALTATTEYTDVLADDDITFPTRVTAALIDSMHEGHLVGLEDFWPMRHVIGRFMIFHRSLWEHVGGFDESRPHGGDTDFAIRCEKAGARVLRLPRRLIPHHDATSEFSKSQHLEWLTYLFRRHPRQVAVPAIKLALKNLGAFTPRETEYPEGWASTVWSPPSEAPNEE